MIGRLIAWGLFVLALAAICRDLAMLVAHGDYIPVTMSDLWSLVDQGSLDSVEAALSADAHPLLWRWGLGPLLEAPVWFVLAVLGALAAFTIGRPRKRKWRSGALG